MARNRSATPTTNNAVVSVESLAAYYASIKEVFYESQETVVSRFRRSKLHEMIIHSNVWSNIQKHL